tara:strand:- start:541 stop:699 length:159 start_codon:yes stop_codon:yes gene_type:complete
VEQVLVGEHGLHILLVTAVVAVVLTTTGGVAVAVLAATLPVPVMMVLLGIRG